MTNNRKIIHLIIKAKEKCHNNFQLSSSYLTCSSFTYIKTIKKKYNTSIHIYMHIITTAYRAHIS